MRLTWTPPPGWPTPAPGWQPPAGWQPDPTWPPAPEDWRWWQPAPRRRGLRWLIAAVAMLPIAVALLVIGLLLPSIALVYLSILAGLAWLPMLAVGVVLLVTDKR